MPVFIISVALRELSGPTACEQCSEHAHLLGLSSFLHLSPAPAQRANPLTIQPRTENAILSRTGGITAANKANGRASAI